MKQILAFPILLFAISCEEIPDDELIACTTEFRTIGITITGGSLDDFYTIRKSNQEEIRYSGDQVYEDTYPVLTDNYQSSLAGKEETFQFIGIINEQIVVEEDFAIKADNCHIEYVSGQTEISLSS